MNEPANKGGWSTQQKILVAVVLVLLFTTFLTVVAVFVFLRARPTNSIQRSSREQPEVVLTAPAVPPSPQGSGLFAKVSDADIPGLYKHTDGGDESFIVLYDDHTFMNRDGTTYRQYRWDVTPDSLDLMWQSGLSRFTNFEGPGIFSYVRSSGPLRRLEKQPASMLTNASLTATGVIAFIRFGATSETNGLFPVNSWGDGAIFPGEAGGEPCYHLMRKPNKGEAYLYLRIAGECKRAPYSNVVVVVEYFDSPPAGAGGVLYIEYDAVAGPYTRTEHTVRLTGSNTWKEEVFVLDQPRFRNHQNALGDFRVSVVNPNLSVRGVKVVENKPR
jgi:hypothetical protein